MNVSQLIELLKSQNPDDMVVISGYEGGVNEVNHVTPTEIALDCNDEWYYGKHERWREAYHSKKAKTRAIQIS